MARSKITEAELARIVVTELQRLGYDTYEEVQCGSGSKRADIVAIQGSISMIVEVKLSLSLALLDQLTHWVGLANRIVGAIPPKRLSVSANSYCRMRGFGLWLVDNAYDTHIDERIVPRTMRFKYPHLGIRRWCKSEHQSGEYASAGSKGGGYWTPFNQTCKTLSGIVRRNPGIKLKDALDQFNHHYSSKNSAMSSLPDLIRRGVVEGIQIKAQGRYLCLWPDNKNENSP